MVVAVVVAVAVVVGVILVVILGLGLGLEFPVEFLYLLSSFEYLTILLFLANTAPGIYK